MTFFKLSQTLLLALFLTTNVAAFSQENRSCNINIKNENDYEQSFLKGLKTLCKEDKLEIKLDGNILSVDNSNYTIIDDNIAFNKDYFFESNVPGKIFTLKLRRKNFSSITINLTVKSNGKIKQTKEETLTISPSFFLGAESDEDKTTGQQYFVTEYWAPEEKDFFAIRIGQDSKTLRANLRFKNETLNQSLKIKKIVNF